MLILGGFGSDHFWIQSLAPLSERWPHRVSGPLDGLEGWPENFGIAVLSKQPIRLVEEIESHGRVVGLVAELDVAGERVRVVAGHPERPGRGERIEGRNAALAQMAASAAQSTCCVVLGDLNTSVGSPAFARLLRDGGLIDSRAGFGRQPSWCTFRPIRGLWVDIDHILLGARLTVLDRRLGRDTGSDHRPVIADLLVRSGDER